MFLSNLNTCFNKKIQEIPFKVSALLTAKSVHDGNYNSLCGSERFSTAPIVNLNGKLFLEQQQYKN